MYYTLPIISVLISICLCYFVYKKESLFEDLPELKKAGLIGLGNILIFSFVNYSQQQSAFMTAFVLGLYCWIFAQKAVDKNTKVWLVLGYIFSLLLMLGTFLALFVIITPAQPRLFIFEKIILSIF